MAKAITQETFDNVVKENLEEFGMTQEEAIEDAIQQFEAQGVNLANIVKDLSLQESNAEGTAVHQVVQAVEDLSALLKKESFSLEELAKICQVIQSECNIDLARRCLASKHGAYKLLLDAAIKVKNDTLKLKVALETLCSLVNGQPDLLDDTGTLFFMDLIKKIDLSNENVMLSVEFIRLTCVKHEHNRQSYVSKEIISALVNLLESHQNNADVVREVCFALRVLTNDDDIRVPFGKAHEHAKMIVTEEDALSKILRICKDYEDDFGVLGELFLTLARLAVRDEFCQEILELGGLKLILSALEKCISQQTIVVQALKVMKTIAGNDKVKVAIVKSGGAHLILEAITRHQKNPAVCEIGCSAIATIVLRNPENCKAVMEATGADILVKTMQLQQNNAVVQKQACMAVRNLVARCREYCPVFLELGAESLLQNTLTNHPSAHDECKAALRDLGCKVELKERWTGEGKGIHH